MYGNVRLRWLIHVDLQRVLEVEDEAFGDDAWNRVALEGLITSRNTAGIIAEVDSVAVGFLVYEIHREHFEIKRVAVRPFYRRKGVASLLVDKVIERTSYQRPVVLVEVPEDLLASQLFFSASGFFASGIIPASGGLSGESAYLFALSVNEERPRCKR